VKQYLVDIVSVIVVFIQTDLLLLPYCNFPKTTSYITV